MQKSQLQKNLERNDVCMGAGQHQISMLSA